MLTNPLFLTVLIEAIVLFLLHRKDPLFHLYWAALTALSNTLANLCLQLSFFDTQAKIWCGIAAVELFVFLFEFFFGFLYTKDKGASAKYSAVCNLASFGIGTLLLSFIPS